MKPKTMILMGLAIVCGLGASYMTSRLLAERGAPPEEEKVKILVARRTLSVGEKIRVPQELFEIKEVTKDNEPPDSIKDFDALKNKIMKQSRNRGDHVTAASLYEKDGLDIPDGYVAVGLPVNLATTAFGWASLPGSRVDLILTVRAQNIRDINSRVLLKNVLVLAADGRTSREGELNAPASVVICALSKKDSLTVNAAKEMGTLTLSLRKLNDEQQDTDTNPVTGGAIMDGFQKQEEPKVIAQALPEPKAEVVKPEEPKGDLKHLTIINNGQITKHAYRQFENGDVKEDEGTQSYGPAPIPQQRPRIQPQPQQQQRPAPQGSKGGPAQAF